MSHGGCVVGGLTKRRLAQRYFNKDRTEGVVELLRVAVEDATLRMYIRAMQA